MTTHTYDTRPELPTSATSEEDKRPPLPGMEPLGKPVKKKETSGEKSTTNIAPDGSFILSKEQQDQQDRVKANMAKAFGTNNTDAPDIHDDPIANVLAPYEKKTKQTFADLKLFGGGDRNVSASTGQSAITDPFRKVNQSKTKSDVVTEHNNAASDYQRVAAKVIDTVFPNGEAAEDYLKREYQKRNGNLPDNNQTIQIAANKAANLEGMRKSIENSQGDIRQAAMNMARNNDSYLNDQLTSLEKNSGLNGRMGGINEYKNIIPNALQGRYVDMMLHQPDIDVLAKRDPELKDQVDKLRNGGLYEEFPDYAIQKFANEISRQRESEGGNNWVANPIFNNSKYLDHLADRMYKNDPVALDFINKHLKGQWEGKIDTPGFLDEFGTSAQHTLQGMGGTVKDIFGQGDNNAERVYGELEKQNEVVSSNPKGFHKIVGIAGNFLGMVAPMAVGTSVLEGTGMSAATANRVIVPTAFYDQEKNEWAAKYPNDPDKAELGATASALAFMMAPDAFPNKRLANAAQQEFKGTVASELEKLSELTSVDAKQKIADELGNKFASVVKETAKNTTKGATEMLAINQFKAGLDHYLGLNEQEYNKRYNDDAVVDIAKSMLIGGLLPNYLSAYGNRNAAAESLYSISQNKERYKDALMDQKLSPDELQKKRSDIDFLSETAKQLNDEGIPVDKQKRYLLEALQEKNEKEKVPENADSNIKKKSEDKIKQHQEVKDQILKGEEPSPLPKDEGQTFDEPSLPPHELVVNLAKDDKLGPYSTMVKDDPKLADDVLKDFAQQIYGITSDGSKLEGGSREGALSNQYSHDVVLAAKEAFPTPESTLKNENTSKATKAGTKSNEQTKAEQPGEATLSIEGEQKPPEPPAEAKLIAEGEEGNKVGVSHESLSKLAKKLGLPEPERGTVLTNKEYADRGRELIKSGARPYEVANKFKETGEISPDIISVARAHLEDLERSRNQIGDKLGQDSQEYKDAAEETRKWMTDVVKPMGTAGGATFTSLQGERDIDTGSFTALKSLKEESQDDKPLTEKQEKEAKELSSKVASLLKEVDDLKQKLTDTLDTESAKNTGKKKQKKTHEEYVKERKDSFQAARDALKQLRSGQSGLSVSIPLVRELSAVAPHISKIVKSLIDEGVDKLGDIVDTIHDELSKDMVGLRRRDVLDLVAGDYNKQTDQSADFNKYADIKKQSKLVKKLEDLQQGLPENFDSKKPEQSSEVKELVEKIKKIKKDLADMGYMKGKPDFEKVPLTPEEKNINRLQKELDDLQQGIVKQKSPPRERSDKEKELQEKIKGERAKMGLTASKQEKPLTEDEQKQTDEEKLKSVQEKFVDKKDNKFTPEDAKSIWDYAKENYIDKGSDFDEMISKTSIDLGLRTDQVRDALTTPKGTKAITDAMYKKQYERNKAIQMAKDWAKSEKKSFLGKFLGAIPRFFFAAKVFGHGTVGMITHAGVNIYDPVEWKRYWPTFFKQFKFAYGNIGDYEKAMQDLKNDPDFIKWKRAGLAVDPSERYDEYQFITKLFNKMGKVGHWLTAGDRGFNALKVYRLQRAKALWGNSSDVERADKNTPKEIAALVNHSTGTTGLKVSEAAQVVFFAPNLELSRWNKLIVDPAKAVKTFTNWNNATPSEKIAAKIVSQRAGRVLATYISALAVNQGLLSLSGSNQKINFFNPMDSDWLKFKAGGRTIDATGGMISLIGFLTRMGHTAIASGKDLKGKNRKDELMNQAWTYGSGKLSPFASTSKDVITHHDFAGNTLPFFDDKPLHSWNKKLTLKEYIEKQQTPIPVAEFFTDLDKRMEDEGVNKSTASQIMKSIFVAAIVGGTGTHIGEEAKPKAATFNDKDKSNPAFKYFLDKGLELPNTVHTSEEIKNDKTKTSLKISDYPQDIQDKYDVVHKEILSQELKKVLASGHVFVKEYKDAKGEQKNEVSLTHQVHAKRKQISALSQEELIQVLHLSQAQATKKAKKKIFKTH